MATHLLLESRAAGLYSPQGPAGSSSRFTGMLASSQGSASTWGLIFLKHRLGPATRLQKNPFQLCLARSEGQLLHATEMSTQVSDQSPSASYPLQLRGHTSGWFEGWQSPTRPLRPGPNVTSRNVLGVGVPGWLAGFNPVVMEVCEPHAFNASPGHSAP